MKIGKTEVNICSYCGRFDLRYGYQSGNCRMYGALGFLENQETIHHLICADCGGIVFSWVKNSRKYFKDIPDKSI